MAGVTLCNHRTRVGRLWGRGEGGGATVLLFIWKRRVAACQERKKMVESFVEGGRGKSFEGFLCGYLDTAWMVQAGRRGEEYLATCVCGRGRAYMVEGFSLRQSSVPSTLHRTLGNRWKKIL